MRRRDFIVSVGGATLGWPLAARAQQHKVAKIGILLVGGREPFAREFDAGLRALGLVEGQNIQFEYRSAGGKLPALAGLAAELVGLNVDAIVASETPAVSAVTLKSKLSGPDSREPGNGPPVLGIAVLSKQ